MQEVSIADDELIVVSRGMSAEPEYELIGFMLGGSN